MELKLGATVSYFLWSLLAGGVLALVYDFFRSSRRLFVTSVFGINLEDVLFFLFFSFMMFWIAYDKNDGQLRFQGFLGTFFGFGFYRLIFRDVIVKILVFLSKQAVKFTFVIINIILLPCRVICKILAKPFYVIVWYSRQGLNWAEQLAKVIGRRREMKKKCGGS